VCIGDNAEQPGRYWNGWIDDVRIYSYALGITQVEGLYAAGKGISQEQAAAARGKLDDF
jgi:hypothetical protein